LNNLYENNSVLQPFQIVTVLKVTFLDCTRRLIKLLLCFQVMKPQLRSLPQSPQRISPACFLEIKTNNQVFTDIVQRVCCLETPLQKSYDPHGNAGDRRTCNIHVLHTGILPHYSHRHSPTIEWFLLIAHN